jgi:hypothetical protein
MVLLTNTMSFCNSNDFQLTNTMSFDDSVVSGYVQCDNQEHICDEQRVGFHIIQNEQRFIQEISCETVNILSHNDNILQARPQCGTCGEAWCDCS